MWKSSNDLIFLLKTRGHSWKHFMWNTSLKSFIVINNFYFKNCGNVDLSGDSPCFIISKVKTPATSGSVVEAARVV